MMAGVLNFFLSPTNADIRSLILVYSMLIRGILKTHFSKISNRGLVMKILAKKPTKVMDARIINIPKPGNGMGKIPSKNCSVNTITYTVRAIGTTNNSPRKKYVMILLYVYTIAENSRIKNTEYRRDHIFRNIIFLPLEKEKAPIVDRGSLENIESFTNRYP
jgi:hypothetical protein